MGEVADPLLGHALLADVAEHADVVAGGAVGGAYGGDVLPGRKAPAVGAQQLALASPFAMALDAGADVGAGPVALRGVEQGLAIAATAQAGERKAGHRGARAVGIDDAMRGVHDHDALRAALEHAGGEALLFAELEQAARLLQRALHERSHGACGEQRAEQHQRADGGERKQQLGEDGLGECPPRRDQRIDPARRLFQLEREDDVLARRAIRAHPAQFALQRLACRRRQGGKGGQDRDRARGRPPRHRNPGVAVVQHLARRRIGCPHQVARQHVLQRREVEGEHVAADPFAIARQDRRADQQVMAVLGGERTGEAHVAACAGRQGRGRARQGQAEREHRIAVAIEAHHAGDLAGLVERIADARRREIRQLGEADLPAVIGLEPVAHRTAAGDLTGDVGALGEELPRGACLAARGVGEGALGERVGVAIHRHGGRQRDEEAGEQDADDCERLDPLLQARTLGEGHA